MVGVLFKETVCSIPAKVDNICPPPITLREEDSESIHDAWRYSSIEQLNNMCGILTCPCVIFILHVYTISLLQWSVNTFSIINLHHPLCIRIWNPCIPVLTTSDKVSAFAPNLKNKLCHSAVKHFTPIPVVAIHFF